MSPDSQRPLCGGRCTTWTVPTAPGGDSCLLQGNLKQEAWLQMKSPVRDTQTWSHAQWLCHLGKVPYTLSFSLFFPKVATQPSTARHCYGHAYGTISGVPSKAWPGQAHSQGSCPALGLHAGSSRGPGPCLPVLKMALSRHPMPPEFSVVLFPFRPPLAFARKTDHRDVRCHPTPLALETLPWGTGRGGGDGCWGKRPT